MKTKAKKTAKKAAVKKLVATVVTRAMPHPLEEVEALLSNPPQAVDKWLLLPVPEPRFAGVANRQKFLDAVAHARIPLVYDKFGRLYDHARELSDAGGILRVEVKRIRSWVSITHNRQFVDGRIIDE